MKRALTIVIDSGKTTCASKPGKFCQQLKVSRMGTDWVCGLFDHAIVTAVPADGWLQRLPECIAAEESK